MPPLQGDRGIEFSVGAGYIPPSFASILDEPDHPGGAGGGFNAGRIKPAPTISNPIVGVGGMGGGIPNSECAQRAVDVESIEFS